MYSLARPWLQAGGFETEHIMLLGAHRKFNQIVGDSAG